jgi:hypothetical protein
VRPRHVIAPFVLLAAALLARRRLRRQRVAAAPLPASPQAPPLALTEPISRFVSVPWTLVEASTSEPRLTIRFHDDDYTEFDRIDAQETPTQVFVTVLMHWRPPAGGWFAVQRAHEASVPLSRPLGERELVHAPLDHGVPGAEPDGGGSGAPPLYP